MIVDNRWHGDPSARLVNACHSHSTDSGLKVSFLSATNMSDVDLLEYVWNHDGDVAGDMDRMMVQQCL